MLFKANLNQIDDFSDAYSVKDKAISDTEGGNPL